MEKYIEDNSVESPIITGQMTMTVAAPRVGSFVVNLELLGTGEATINWGDGKSHQTVTLSDDDTQVIGPNGMHWNVPIDCKHIYPDSSTITITIIGNVTCLNCSGNQLTNLDVSNDPALELLNCSKNQLISLDVSNNITLKALNCSGNQLTSLDVSNNTTLRVLDCSGNQLKSDALNALFESLHNKENGEELIYSYISGLRNVPIYRGSGTDRKSIYVNANSGANSCDRSIATNKGWIVSELGRFNG
jgi:Leucine-rich repeat (LRR) protein